MTSQLATPSRITLKDLIKRNKKERLQIPPTLKYSPLKISYTFKFDYTHLLCHAVSSGKAKMFDVIMETIDLDLPAFMGTLFSYAANPGLIIPAILLMV